MTIITITDNVGCGGSEISASVAQQLGVPLYDDDTLQKEAVELGIVMPDLEWLDEKAPGLFDRILSQRPDVFLDLMESVVLAVARKGEGVIIGHGSQVLLRDFVCAFHIRIYSPVKNRLQRIMETQGLDSKAAAKIIKKMDSRQEDFFRFAFHQDRDALSLYDLNLNTAKIGPQATADLIVAAVNNPLITECTPNSLETFGRLSLEKRVEAELLKHSVDLHCVTVDAPNNKKVIISGMVPTDEDLETISTKVREAFSKAVEVELSLTLTPRSTI